MDEILEYTGTDISGTQREREIAKNLDWSDYLWRYVSIITRNRLGHDSTKTWEKVRFGFVLEDREKGKIFTLFAWLNIRYHGKVIPRKLLIKKGGREMTESYLSVYKEKISEKKSWQEAIDYIHHNPDPTRFTQRRLSHLVTEREILERAESIITTAIVDGPRVCPGPHKIDRAEINNNLILRKEKITLGPAERGLSLDGVIPF